jgi:hypothetical protein
MKWRKMKKMGKKESISSTNGENPTRIIASHHGFDFVDNFIAWLSREGAC